MLAYRQLKEGHRTQKAPFFKDLYQTMFSDRDIRDAYYQVEYGDFSYDETFHGSENEKRFDRLLSFLDLRCDLYRQRIISQHEMSFFRYELMRIYGNANTRRYLEFLSRFYQSVGSGTRPFCSFVSYCEKTLSAAQQQLS